MRKLNTADVFAMARIVRASGLRGELQALIKSYAGSGRSEEEIGIEGFLTILEAMAERRAESAIYEALSGPFELSADEVAALPLDQLMANLKQLSAENDLKYFFGCASRILGKN